MRFRLRTLLIVLAVGPLVIRGIRLQYQQMADEGRRMEKGLPTFTEP
jgi:hypothetical protein